MRLTPESWGSELREFNPCHEPSGSVKGGRFCASHEVTRVGITTARPKDDAKHYRTNKQVGEDMRALEATLKRLPGVRAVSVKPALGQWAGGSEFSFAVSYVGNGEARRALAQLAQKSNQDAVLILRAPHAGEKHDAATEIVFDKPVGLAARTALADYMGSLGLGGWTWYKRNGKTTLRVVSVPEWGGDNASHRTAMATLATKLRGQGLGIRERQLRVKTEVYSRSGDVGQSYSEVILRAEHAAMRKTVRKERDRQTQRIAQAVLDFGSMRNMVGGYTS